MKHRYFSNYPSPTDPDEIRIVEYLNERGVSIRRIQHLAELPDLMNQEIANDLAKEIPSIKDQGIKSTAIFAIALPVFHDISMPIFVDAANQSRDNSRLLNSAIVNAILRVGKKGDEKHIESLLLEKKLGVDRSLLILLYAKIEKKNAIPFLLRCVGDPVTKVEALRALTTLGELSIEKDLIALSSSENSHFRKIARDCLKRLEKRRERSANKTKK